jgi:hypothetical protein
MHEMERLRRLGKGMCRVACLGLLAGCQTLQSTDPGKINFRIPPGSKLVLNREISIPAGVAHVILQHGAVGTAANEFEVNCRFEARNLGPRVIQPDTFLITSSGSQRDWVNQPNIMRFYKVFYLKSERQPDIMPMYCQYWSYPLIGRPLTVRQVQEALGDHFTFEFAQ